MIKKRIGLCIIILIVVQIAACGEGKTEGIPTLDQYKEILAQKASVEKKQQRDIINFIEGISESEKYTMLNSEINQDGVFISFKFSKGKKSLIGVAYGVTDQNDDIKFVDHKINEVEGSNLISNVYIRGKLQSTPPRDYIIVAGITNKDIVRKIKLIFDRKDTIVHLNEENGDFMFNSIGPEKLNKIEIYDKNSLSLEEVIINETP